jgi:DNA-binding CsgD family transcriptional regulator
MEQYPVPLRWRYTEDGHYRAVKTHVHNAFAKLGINSREQLTRLTRGSD